MWHVRFFVDVAGQDQRRRKSVPVGPCKGSNKLSKPEAERKAAEIVASLGVNTKEHLERAKNITPVTLFKHRVDWCRRYHKAWTEGKPKPATIEGQLRKHILPRFGDMPLDAINETAVQEFAADLRRATFEMRKPNGDVVKRYHLSRKTIFNIVGLVKLILGRKVWITWSLDLGKPTPPQQRYFTEGEMYQIIDAAPERYRLPFTLLAGTGMRIGEAAGLHVDNLDLANGVIYVRRAVSFGLELSPKTVKAVREIDVDPEVAGILKEYLGDKTAGRVFEPRNGSPVSDQNIRRRVLHPLLKRLGIPKAGLHALPARSGMVLRKRPRQPNCRSSGLGIPLCGQRTGTHTLTKSLNSAAKPQETRGFMGLLDPIDPN